MIVVCPISLVVASSISLVDCLINRLDRFINRAFQSVLIVPCSINDLSPVAAVAVDGEFVIVSLFQMISDSGIYKVMKIIDTFFIYGIS